MTIYLHERMEKCCWNCKHSYNNCAAVGVRLGCDKKHISFLSFALPHDFICKGKDWEKK